MYECLWKLTGSANRRGKKRAGVFLLLTTLLAAGVGCFGWLVAGSMRNWGLDELVLLAGYFALIFGFFGGILYLFNHE